MIKLIPIIFALTLVGCGGLKTDRTGSSPNYSLIGLHLDSSMEVTNRACDCKDVE